MPLPRPSLVASLCFAVITPTAAIGQVTLQGAGTAGLVVTPVVSTWDPAAAVGTTAQVGRDSDLVSGAATITFHWTASDLPGGVTAAAMRPMWWDGREWHAATATTQSNDSAVVQLRREGIWAMRWAGSSASCIDAAFRTLDFRLGKWDFRSAGYDPGRSEVYEAPNRCAITDRYDDRSSGRSRSFYVYSTADAKWYSTTIDPEGRFVSVGTAWGDSAAFYRGNSKREVYRRRADNSILYTGEESSDGGKTWTVTVTATYTRPREEL
jgi:hypothetical protein